MEEEGKIAVEGVSGENPLFLDEKIKIPCTFAKCLAGHMWKPTFTLVDCPECKGPCLMGKMENCPYCNEPMGMISLRHDHIPKGGGVARRCLGEKAYGEMMDVVLERNHWRLEESK